MISGSLRSEVKVYGAGFTLGFPLKFRKSLSQVTGEWEGENMLPLSSQGHGARELL